MIYLACFSLSTLFAFLANRAKQRKYFLLFSVISILLPVLLAGLRNYSVGIDTDNYLTMERFWYGAIRAPSLWNYLQNYLLSGYREPLFALFLGIIAQLTGNFRVFLFLAHLVIMINIYIGAYRLKHKVPPVFVSLFFFLLYYNVSLNITRQFMALAIIFAFFSDLEQRKFVRYSVVVLFVSLIHTTALLGFIPLFFYLFLYPQKTSADVSSRRLLCLCLLVIVGTVCFVPIIKLLMQSGILSEKYNFFLEKGYHRLSFTRLGLLILELLGFVYCYRNFKLNVSDYAYYIVHTLMFMCMQFLSSFIVYGNRIVLYFAFVNIITVLLMLQTFKRRKIRIFVFAAAVILSLYFWYYIYVAAKSSETIPYLSCFDFLQLVANSFNISKTITFHL